MVTHPGHPTHVRGAYRYGPVDGPTSAYELLNASSQQVGYLFDDGTPNLDSWIQVALPLARSKGLVVVVLVAWNNFGLHHPGCVNLYEAYWKGRHPSMEAWFRNKILPASGRYAGYVMQKAYGFQDQGGGPQDVPTSAEYWWLRHELAGFDCQYGLWDF